MRPNDSAFEELEAILRKESEAHERLLAVAHDVNNAAGKGNLEDIRRQTVLLDEEAAGIERLEEQRRTCCEAIGKNLKLPQESPRLSTIIEHAPSNSRTIIAALSASLKVTLARIASINAANRLLCEEGARFAQGQLNIIMQPAVKYVNYRSRGNRCAQGVSLHSLINRTA